MSNLDTADGSTASPPAKRRRVLAACTKCRMKKEKCDGKQPSCSSCLQGGHECIYRQSTKRRGLAAGYVRLLESLMGMIVQEVKHGEETIKSLLDHCVNQLDTEARSQFQQVWRKSDVYTEFDNSLPSIEFLDERELSNRKSQRLASIATELEEQSPLPAMHQLAWQTPDAGSSTLGEQNIVNQTFGHSSDTGLETTRPSEDPIRAQLGENITGLAGPSSKSPHTRLGSGLYPNETSRVLPPRLEYPVSEATGNKACPLLPENAWQLIDVYFTYTNSWLPIVDRATIMKTFTTYNQAGLSTTENQNDEHAVLWAILAYTHKQSMAGRSPRGPSFQSDCDRSRQYYDVAREITSRLPSQFDISYAQALLLLSLTDIGDGRIGLAWVTAGHAARISVEIAKEQATHTLEPLQKQVLLGCFVLDTLTSTYLNRSPQLRTHDFDQLGLMTEAGLEEWDSWRAMPTFAPPSSLRAEAQHQPARTCSTFNQLCKSMAILNDAISSPKTGPGKVSYENLVERSRLWLEQLPPFFEAKRYDNCESTPILPHVSHAYMCHVMSLLCLYSSSEAVTPFSSHQTLDLDANVRRLLWLLEGAVETFGPNAVPATFTIFGDVLKSRFDPSPSTLLSSSLQTSTSYKLQKISESISGAWTGFPTQWDPQHNIAEKPSQSLFQAPEADMRPPQLSRQVEPEQPRLFPEYGNFTGVEANNPPVGAFSSGDRAGSVMLTGPAPLAEDLSFGLYDIDTTIDENTFQSMLLQYGSQRSEPQADFWRNLGFFD